MSTTSAYRPWRTALGLFLPMSLGIGLLIAGIGTTMWPPVTGWAASLMCAGKVVDASETYTTPSGGSGVQRHILCVKGAGASETKEEITFDGIALAWPVYSLLIFIGCLVFAAPRMRRKAEAQAQVFNMGSFTVSGGSDSGEAPQDLMALVAAAMQQGNVTVRNVTIDSSDMANGDDPAARLAHLKQLHDAGLISDADFEAKKTEILSGL